MSKYQAEVKLWPLRPEYHLYNTKYQISVKQLQSKHDQAMHFSDGFENVGQAKTWAEGILVSYFNWTAKEAIEACNQAEVTMNERAKPAFDFAGPWPANNRSAS